MAALSGERGPCLPCVRGQQPETTTRPFARARAHSIGGSSPLRLVCTNLAQQVVRQMASRARSARARRPRLRSHERRAGAQDRSIHSRRSSLRCCGASNVLLPVIGPQLSAGGYKHARLDSSRMSKPWISSLRSIQASRGKCSTPSGLRRTRNDNAAESAVYEDLSSSFGFALCACLLTLPALARKSG